MEFFLVPIFYEMANDYIFFTTGNANEINPVIKVQNGEEMMEEVENTSGHSEHTENVQINENSLEESEEREEIKTTTGFTQYTSVLLKLDDYNNFVLQCILSNINKETSKHVPTRDVDYPTLCSVMCTGLFSPLFYFDAFYMLEVLPCLKGNQHIAVFLR